MQPKFNYRKKMLVFEGLTIYDVFEQVGDFLESKNDGLENKIGLGFGFSSHFELSRLRAIQEKDGYSSLDYVYRIELEWGKVDGESVETIPLEEA